MTYSTILFAGLFTIIAVSIAFSLIGDLLRKKDFKDQVEGRKPERKAKKNMKYSYDKPQQEDPYITAGREGMKMKSGQNMFDR